MVHDEGEPLPYGAELIPWAITDNGDVCYWATSTSSQPDDWTVVVNEVRGPLWFSFDGGACSFLVAVLSNELRCAIFPEDFPSAEPGFQPLSS